MPTMTITPTLGTLEVADTVQLTAINAAGQVVTGVQWTSSNTGLATVVAGLVTGVAAGKVTIRAKKANAKAYSQLVVFAALPETPTPPPPLILTCPSTLNLTSADGDPVPASYTATTTGGTAPITITYDPPSGTALPVGTTTVDVTATSSDGQTASPCSFDVVVTYIPAVVGRGPQASITCPIGAVPVATSASLQAAINANPGATTFCLAAGVHPLTASIIPKSGNTFVGEYGAILDGTGWTSTDFTQGAFRAWNAAITNVTITNLLIRHMPQKGIAVSGTGVTGWTIEHNEITSCGREALGVPSGSTVSNNYIHHNPYGGYSGYQVNTITVDNNEIAYNGPEQKFTGSTNCTWVNNFVHHNTQDGIWFDTDNVGYVIQSNTVEDHGRFGIHVEISGAGVISTNTVNRSADTGVMIVMCNNVETASNTITDNFRGIQYYLKCSIIGGGSRPGGYDLRDNDAHDNVITLPATAGAWASSLGWPSADGACASTYLSGAKNLTFTHNAYTVPNLTTKYWRWGLTSPKLFTEWQAVPQDATGTVST